MNAMFSGFSASFASRGFHDGACAAYAATFGEGGAQRAEPATRAAVNVAGGPIGMPAGD